MESYYKIKQKYDKKKSAAIKKIYNNDDFTLEEKRDLAKKYKQGCVECKRKVGTIFYIQDNMLKAKCGNVKKPCKLNLSVEKTKTTQIQELISTIEKNISSTREDIIKTKLNFLFKYANEDETLERFETKKNELNLLTDYLHKLKEELKQKLNQDERDLIIEENNITYNEAVKQINENIAEYKSSKNIQYLKDNAMLIKDTIFPILDKMRDAKYDVCVVEESVIEDNSLYYKVYREKNAYSKTEKVL
jgi:hypothetical protein